MKVKELIAALSQCNLDAEVFFVHKIREEWWYSEYTWGGYKTIDSEEIDLEIIDLETKIHITGKES